jgi:hypothetical protein
MLWKWMGPTAILIAYRAYGELTVATALALRRRHTDTLIVPMYRSATPTGPRSSAAWQTRG